MENKKMNAEERAAIEEQQRICAKQFEQAPELAMVASMAFVAALELLGSRESAQ